MTIPTSRLTMTVRGAKTIPLFGKSMPKLTRSAFSPTASASPRSSPMTDAMIPTTSASRSTEASTWRREAPRVRSVASSRIRWATVMASVFAITKAPTKSAIPPKASRRYLKKFRPSWTSWLSDFACSSPLFTCAVAGSTGLTSLTSVEVETPGFAATSI
jgi:hypothetical protein